MHRVRAARGSADAARRIHHGRAERGGEEDGEAVGEVEEDEGLRIGDSRFNDAAEGVAGEVATAGGVRVRGHIQDENVEGRVVGGCGGEESRGCQDKYPISGATVIANKTTTSDIILPEQLGILTWWRPGHPIGGLLFFNGQSWTNILRHILDYIRILAGIRPKSRILTTPGGEVRRWGRQAKAR